jgi:hypothetical protein
MWDGRKKLLKYMKDQYDKTLFPFFKLTDLTYMFGEGVRTELNRLVKEKIVTKRNGINSPLVEITTRGIEILKRIEKHLN